MTHSRAKWAVCLYYHGKFFLKNFGREKLSNNGNIARKDLIAENGFNKKAGFLICPLI